MNIGIFTDAYDPQINGVVISTKILKQELEAKGHNVTIITVSDPGAHKESGILRLPSIPFFVLPDFRVGSLYSPRIMRRIKKLNLDIIHTQTEFSLGIFGRICAKRLSIPIVHTYHTMYEDYSHYFSFKVMDKYAKHASRRFSRLMCRTVDNVIVPTEKVASALETYGLKKDLNIIPTGVDLKPFAASGYNESEREKARVLCNIENHNKVLLFVGRLAKEKSIDTIIKSLPEIIKVHHDLVFLVVGDGPEMNYLKELAEQLNVSKNVRFVGKQPWQDIGVFYQLADVFVSASTSETQGLTYIEAMAAHKAVVAKYDTNLDDVVLDGKTGRFFYNDDELAGIVIDLMTNEHLRYSLSKNGFNSVQDLSSVHFGNAVESLYFETVYTTKELVTLSM